MTEKEEDQMEQIKIKAEERAEQGSGAVRRLRRAGIIPGSVTRMKKGGTLLVKLSAHDFMLAMRGHTSKQLLVTLELNGSEVPALMREVQNDVIGGTPIHVDFGEVSLTAKVRVSIPLVLVGEPSGVKVEGGILEQVLRTIEVECLPTDLVEQFAADVSALKLNDSLFVRDLKLGDKYTLVTRGDVAVAVVTAPEAEEVATPAATTATAEAATPEVIAKGKKEEEGAEGAAEPGKPGEKKPEGKPGEKKPEAGKPGEKKPGEKKAEHKK